MTGTPKNIEGAVSNGIEDTLSKDMSSRVVCISNHVRDWNRNILASATYLAEAGADPVQLVAYITARVNGDAQAAASIKSQIQTALSKREEAA